MKNKVFLPIFLVCALTSVAVYGAWAQGVLGVKAGDNFTYSFEVFWRSTNPSMTVPQEFSQLNRTISIHVNVTDVGLEAAVAYVNVTKTMRDGSQTSAFGLIGLASGNGVEAQLLIIGANLTAGDKAYPLSDPDAVKAGAAAASFTITETVTKTYLGTSKTVNHYFERINNATTGNYVDRNAYYDRETGILLEMTIEHYYADMDEIDSEHWKITQFNAVSTTPSDGTNDGTDGTNSTGSFPSWLVPVVIVVVVVVVAALAAMVMLRRRRKAEVQAPPQTPPQTPV
jgi:hypothetical protein